MNFRDEYEFELDGATFYVEVEGERYLDEGKTITELSTIDISDSDGPIDSDHQHYFTIRRDAEEREYELEVHSRDFDYYGAYGA